MQQLFCCLAFSWQSMTQLIKRTRHPINKESHKLTEVLECEAFQKT